MGMGLDFGPGFEIAVALRRAGLSKHRLAETKPKITIFKLTGGGESDVL
jgi:hypothetical protein